MGMPLNMGAPPPMSPGGSDPMQLLSMMAQSPFPPFPDKMQKNKGSKGSKDGLGKEGKKGAKGTPSAKLAKAREMIQGVINELGTQSDLSVALSGLVRNLNTQIDKLNTAPPSEPGPPGMGGPAMPPLDAGTPGQLPAPNMLPPSNLPGGMGAGLM